jgi:hypothetical protein
VRPCGTDVGECIVGYETCSEGAFGACDGEVPPAADDACNGLDDDCDEQIDEGCTCVDGDTQSCGSDVGECRAGTQTCASGTWGACVGETGAIAELCNTLDDDCDGTSDEAFALGTTCDGADADLCSEGTTACDPAGSGTLVCTDATGDTIELCNMLDDDCDTMVDDGFVLGVACDGPDADLCDEGSSMCDASGGVACSDSTGDSVETCNGTDDDCDGNIDEGNPGGGVACAGATDVGGCISRTACVSGSLICRGTFVATSGAAGNPGTPTQPLPSIASAIANAMILGGGADVCVCDAASAGASTFTEDVTMVEGTDVLGGYDCTSWTVTAGRVTAIQDVDDDGVSFPAGLTSATAMRRMTVDGFDRAGAGASTSAITITDASATLESVIARGGDAATSIALRVFESAGATAAPAISNGTFQSSGIATGTAIGVSIEAAAPRFTNTTIGGAIAAGIAGPATTSYGVRCIDCAGTTFSGGSVRGSGATTAGFGFHGIGDLTGFTATTTSFGGGSTTTNASASTGVRLEGCGGAPTFTNTNSDGGFDLASSPLTGTTRTAFQSSGARCAPIIDGGRHIGCERGSTCLGVVCDTASACVVRNAGLVTGSVGSGDTAVHGMRCLGGGCASITTSTIQSGGLRGGAALASGLDLDGASPSVDDCTITGPTGSTTAGTTGRFDAIFVRDTTSTISNCIVRDMPIVVGGSATFNGVTTVVRYDQSVSSGPAALQPTIVNDTIEYSTCGTCGARIGLVVNGATGALAGPLGIVRNDIIRNLLATGTGNPVIERGTAADLAFFQNNALWDPTALVSGLYVDEGTLPLSTATQLNTMMMGGTSGANLVADCALTGAWRLPAGSMCRNAGTSMSCPRQDFDAQARPNEMACDIGADEFYP